MFPSPIGASAALKAELPRSSAPNDTDISKRLLEIVTVWRRSAAGRDMHIDQAVATIGVVSRKQKRVGIPDEPKVGKALVSVGPGDLKTPCEVIGWDRREGLRSDGVLVHGMMLFVAFKEEPARCYPRLRAVALSAVEGTRRVAPGGC